MKPQRNIPVYTTSQTHNGNVNTVTRKPRRMFETTLTKREHQMVLRMRQLFNDGADMVLVERRDNEPCIRTIGKVER